VPTDPRNRPVPEQGDAPYPQGWDEVRGALQRGFRFRDFREAVAFVNRLAELAEAEDHHPDIALSWNAVTVRWWTHTKRAITERDARLAALTNELETVGR
jgi:4a-hydroxytetrahydrobiopterin dehydratase